jgi:prophage tail gpP-like protein
LLIVSDGGDDLKVRAEWERNVRAGRARRVTYRMQGNTAPLGVPWEINRLISVTDSFLDLRERLLVVGYNISHSSSGGTETQIDLCAPQAFDTLKPPLVASKKGGGTVWP